MKQLKKLNDITITYPKFPEFEANVGRIKANTEQGKLWLAQNITGRHFYVNGFTVVTFEELEKLIAKLKSENWIAK